MTACQHADRSAAGGRAGRAKPRASAFAWAVWTGAACWGLCQPAFAQTGAIFWDRRGADGGCCEASNGRDGGAATDNFILTQPDLNVRAIGTAITVDVSGGNGGNGEESSTSQNHWGGNGGYSRLIAYTIANSTIVSTAGAGIVALSKGGDGGKWADGARYGNGAEGHTVSLNLSGTAVFGVGYGVLAQSIGGNGQESAVPTLDGRRNAGVGGQSYDANVTLTNGAAISVQASGTGGSPSELGAGIAAQSRGGQGGTGLHTGSLGGHSKAGRGGAAGNVSVTADGGTTIAASGDRTAGILARAIGGDAHNSPPAPDGIGPIDVAAAAGGAAGHVTVRSGAQISTSGAMSPGILAASIGGNGSNGGNGSWHDGHPGGAGGTPDGITIDNSGAISTTGAGSNGITATVIGGSGGVGGAAGASGHGGNGGSGGGTGALAVQVNHSGSIATWGLNSTGIFAHAVGGGGGAAATSGGIFYVGGGNGGNAGQGGVLRVDSSGSITTGADHSAAILLQSIGGGGGSGGEADSTGVIGAMAVGGRGGAGGDGGNITLTASGPIATSGAASSGLVLQSIGGGGGQGGLAHAVSAGALFDLAVSVGGNGGNGGSAGGLGLTLGQNASVSTAGSLSHAVTAQAIGGGGGNGAFADSTQATIAPVLGDLPSGTVSIQHTVGGAGGTGGNGGAITLDTSGQLTTTGARAYGILAQSIAGGGGNGGTAAAPLRPTTIGASDFSLSFGLTVGGRGAGAGAGATVQLTNQAMARITTSGDQAIGVLAQSIGGGGGSGGAVRQETAHSFSPALGSPSAFLEAVTQVAQWLEKGPTGFKLGSFTMAVDARVGGSGGFGGNGGDVRIDNHGLVSTGGGSAPALVAQSIAGGGGQGGAIHSAGVSSLLASIDSMLAAAASGVSGAFSLSPDIGVNVAVGGSGGGGGDGGRVSIANTGRLATSGFASPGVLAQSIAGGGGAGTVADQSLEAVVRQQGGADAPQILDRIATILDLLAHHGLSLGKNISVSVGRGDGPSGKGGGVTVDASAASSSISTQGNSSPGILAQSIGGGGGTADVSTYFVGAGGFSGGPPSIGLGATKTFSIDFSQPTPAMSGGTVSVTTGGTIDTQGSNSIGVLAQSISGGGGVAAVSIESSAATRLGPGHQAQSPGVALGGNLSMGSTGFFGSTPDVQAGDVTVTANGAVTTSGTLSHGIMAQSVGGGGGIASLAFSPQVEALIDTPSLSLGATSGPFGTPANGGNVSVAVAAGGAVTTGGSLAFGVLAQSVGNGGGYAVLTSADQAYAGATALTFGGRGMSIGAGGAVAVRLDGTLRTSGQDAHGIVAQSVGGGGGIAGLATRPGTVALNGAQSGGTSQVYPLDTSNGGAVDVLANGVLKTTGNGAIGVLAQSVGGGGGIAGDAAAVDYAFGMVQRSGAAASVGAGGQVTVNAGCAPGASCVHRPSAVVATTGANAPAILAMSLGGGAVFKDGGVFLGTPARSNTSAPVNAGGPVAVNLHAGAAVSAMGANSPAIAAISMGSTAAGDALQGSAVAISIDKGASVAANADSGIGILAVTTDVATIRNAGIVSARTAIASDRQTVVDNDGSIAGNIDIGRGSGLASTFNNHAGATFQSGDNLYISWGVLNNAGTISPGGPGVFTTTRLTYGKFNQTSTGTYAADLDFANKRSDVLSTREASYFGGTLTPLTHNPVRGTWLTVIHSDPVFPADSVALTVADRSPVFSYPLRMSEDRRDVRVSVNANFMPVGIALNGDQAAVAGHLQTLWNTGSVKAAPLFGTFTSIADAPSYLRALGTVASDVSLARASGRSQENYAFLNRLMSCPYFSETSGTRLAEGECTWGRVLGAHTDRATTGEDVGYRSRQVTYQVGTQKRIAPDWFLGGSLNHAHTNTTSSDQTVTAASDSLQGGITLKRQLGNWQFAGALFGGAEHSTLKRRIVLPGYSGTATGKPDAWFLGGRVRASHQIAFGDWYIKPFADLDVVYDRSRAYRETGAGLFDLAYRSSGRSSVMATLSAEVGGRIDLAGGGSLRPYLALGVSSVMNGDAKARISLVEFPMEPFQVTTSLPKTYGDATFGLELLTRAGWELRAEYRRRGARGYVDQSGTLRLARHF